MDVVNNSQQEAQVERPDFSVHPEGSIWLFSPQTVAAFQFLEDHIPDDAMYFGTSLGVEHRYAEGLLIGLHEHGLSAVRS